MTDNTGWNINQRKQVAMLALVCLLYLSGCATSPGWLPASGPSRTAVAGQGSLTQQPAIPVLDVTDGVARRLLASRRANLFSETLGDSVSPGYVIGPGDVLEVSIWEAPPALLFGSSGADSNNNTATSGTTTLPETMVSSDGHINVPFAGLVPVAGKSPQQIEAEIVRRLTGKAHQPQVLVRVIRNTTANVTVVGEVATSLRMPLTAQGERILDALAAAGGVRQSISKTALQITRGNRVETLPLDTIIRDPAQNIVLQPGDVITALNQPLSFVVLGATGTNQELSFETQGITLAQALARAGGLQDARADARGVFIFRFEEPDAVDPDPDHSNITPEGKVPVIYRANLKDPATFFVAQGFPMQDRDVMFVSNASAAEFQKFLNIVTSIVYPIININNLND